MDTAGSMQMLLVLRATDSLTCYLLSHRAASRPHSLDCWKQQLLLLMILTNPCFFAFFLSTALCTINVPERSGLND